MPPAPPEVSESPGGGPRSPLELFLAFSALSLQAFGGAVALIERTVVQRKRWLSSEEFLGLYGISQVLPGPTGISFCVLLGDRFFGWRGAIATVAGFLLLPTIVVLGIATMFQQFHHVPQVQGALRGMGAAAVGVIATAVLRLLGTLRGDRTGSIVAAVVFVAAAFGRVPVAWIVMTIGVVSVMLAWRRSAR